MQLPAVMNSELLQQLRTIVPGLAFHTPQRNDTRLGIGSLIMPKAQAGWFRATDAALLAFAVVATMVFAMLKAREAGYTLHTRVLEWSDA